MQRWAFSIILALSLVTAGCRSSTRVPTISPVSAGGINTLSLTSSAFREGDTIPEKYTCDAADVSPDLKWSGIPVGAKSLVLIADDPDAPAGTWMHWVLYNVPPDRTGLPEGVAKTPTVEGIGMQGINDSGNTGYNGPCPPKGKPHRYYFKLYALDITPDLKPGAAKADVEKVFRGHVLAQGQLIGTYSR